MLLLHRCALAKFRVTDGQNMCDQITKGGRSRRLWSNWVLCIPFILSGSPNECWLHTCDACEISTRRLWLQLLSINYFCINNLIHLQLATNCQNNNRFINNYYIIKSMSFLEQHVKWNAFQTLIKFGIGIENLKKHKFKVKRVRAFKTTFDHTLNTLHHSH